jgi:carbamoyltransferase
MTAILGLSAFYHDSAAALVVDGNIIAAAQEERFSRIKHDNRFPHQALSYVLKEGGLTTTDLDYVGFYEKPLLKFDRLLETYLAFAPLGFRSFFKAMPLWLRQKLYLPREIKSGLGGHYTKRIIFPEHHESHAASAFFPSPFESAAIITIDGVGEWTTTSFGIGRGNTIELSHEIHFPHSLGLLYSAFTYFCGFRVNSGEYKLMGLAPYGEPKYADLIREQLIDVREDGSYRLNMAYFNYCQGLTMTSRRFHKLFGGPPRKPESALTQREIDLAASIQKVTETVMMRICRHVHRMTGMAQLCFAGGVALNCVGNGRILKEGPFEDVWIQPAAGDAGGALGTALIIWHQMLGGSRQPRRPDQQAGSALGPCYSNVEIEEFLRSCGAVYHYFTSEELLLSDVADLIADQNVVGWMQGRMEFGPRALGNRSILGDARSSNMQSLMNLKIKFRESFRPFAPVVLSERAEEYFDMPRGKESPYMLLVAPVTSSQRRRIENESSGLEKLKVLRSAIPAVTHVDYSARVQTVDAVRHGRFHRLMKIFEAKCGSAVLINTSFNVRGEPIVNTPADAYNCFMATEMDALVMGDYLLLKQNQPTKNRPTVETYISQFELD